MYTKVEENIRNDPNLPQSYYKLEKLVNQFPPILNPSSEIISNNREFQPLQPLHLLRDVGNGIVVETGGSEVGRVKWIPAGFFSFLGRT